ncbi:MAG TPA: hypothetical protein VJ901_20090 [Thermoanaerobaculia bacterium]|nr:hypothetical protein [Thermoanaerobaculia bacterium]
MRKSSLLLAISLITVFAGMSASAQTLATEGYYAGGEGANATNVTVDNAGVLTFTQSCYAGMTTEAVAVDQYGSFSAAGEFGARPWTGPGYLDPVAVHFAGTEDTGAGTLDITVIEDSTSDVLASVVVHIDDFMSLNHCGM